MGKLVLRLPDGTTRAFALERERVTIGRRADNDICLPFPAVSGEHAAVVTILEDSFLEDLNSTNGTLVNGKPVTKHFLRDNDEIDIGRYTLVYVSGDFLPAAHHPLPEGNDIVAVMTNGGATIGDDETTLVPPLRESRRGVREASPASERVEARDAERSGATHVADAQAAAPEQRDDVARQGTTIERALGGASVASENASHRATPESAMVAPNDATAASAFATPSLEVLDGPSAGRTFDLARDDDFVVGRPGVAIAAIRRADDRHRLVHLEGALRARVNGVEIGSSDRPLASGDEIEIAQTRLRYRAAL